MNPVAEIKFFLKKIETFSKWCDFFITRNSNWRTYAFNGWDREQKPHWLRMEEALMKKRTIHYFLKNVSSLCSKRGNRKEIYLVAVVIVTLKVAEDLVSLFVLSFHSSNSSLIHFFLGIRRSNGFFFYLREYRSSIYVYQNRTPSNFVHYLVKFRFFLQFTLLIVKKLNRVRHVPVRDRTSS